MAHAADAPPAVVPDRRFYAFLLDRLLVWGLCAAAAWAAYVLLIERDRTALGVVLIVAVVVLVWLLSSVGLGLWGVSPGKAVVGIRVVAEEDGGPIGVPRALLRTFILGVATLPTIGFGAAALAWTALADPSGARQGWHDRRARSVVVDIRPPRVVEEPPAESPRPVVNLTAMRLMPASPTPPTSRPDQAPPMVVGAPAPAAVTEGGLSTEPASVTPRQGLGWPLVGGPPGAPPGAPPKGRPPGPTSPPPGRPPPPPPPTSSVHPPAGARSTPGASAPGRWRVSFDTGESFVVEGLTLVGRRPEARSGEPVRHLVSLPSDDMSLSKTHAQFQVVPDGALVVMDRGSTNGSILIRSGATRRLTGGRPATLRPGDRVRFGDREMVVARED